MSVVTSNEAIKEPRFAGHETFSLRYAWLKKAVDSTTIDSLIFTRDDALVRLGVGKNMVRSIRHWGLVTGFLEEDGTQKNNRGRHIKPSELGNLVFGPKGVDPYLEEPGTQWLIHWQLASRAEGPTTWYWTFNHFTENEFTKDQLKDELLRLVERFEWTRVAENSLSRDIDCFVKCYVPSRSKKSTILEDSLECPLIELGLIEETGNNSFAFVRGEHRSLPLSIFTFALCRFWDEHAPSRQTIRFDEVAYQPGGPGRVFKLTESALTDYLEQLNDYTSGKLGFDITAGLRQVYRRGEFDAVSCLSNRRGKGRN